MSAVTAIEAKLRGTFRYLAEDPPPGCLHGAVLFSPVPHARIRSLDISAALALPGVRAVVTAGDVPQGDILLGPRRKDRPPLARGVVRFRGEPAAAVAAETEEIARAALRLIRLDLEPLPILADPEAALRQEAPQLHPAGNLCHDFLYEKGRLEQGFAACAHVVQHVLDTPRQIPAAMELEGGIAWPNDAGGLDIRAATHSPFAVQAALAEMLRLRPETIRVTGSPIGGSYGGKEEMHVQPVLALLAWRAQAPVRLVLRRSESMAFATTRHPFRLAIRIGCDGQGRLRALQADALVDCGAYASFGPEVLETGLECIQGVYAFDAVRLTGRLAYTNNGVAGAFRGFGALQTLTGLELAVDALARQAGIDPLVLRRRSLIAADADGPLGQIVLPQPEIARVADALMALPSRPVAATSPRYLRGIGHALVRKGEGFGGGGPNAADGVLTLTAKGRVALETSLTEMGQGIEAASLTLLKRAFDLVDGDVDTRLGDTHCGRDAGPTSASRGTQMVYRLIRSGAADFRAQLIAEAARLLKEAPSALRLGPGGVYRMAARRNEPDLTLADLADQAGPIALPVHAPAIETSYRHYDTHTLFTCCAARAEVELDRWTGRLRCLSVELIPACGEPVNRLAFDGQMAGAAVQALGFCLTEDLPALDGVFQAGNLDGYMLPTIADAPEVVVQPMTWLAPDDPVGLRGAGEIGINAAAPAIANAVAAALGKAPPRLPVSPGWVLAVLEGLE